MAFIELHEVNCWNNTTKPVFVNVKYIIDVYTEDYSRNTNPDLQVKQVTVVDSLSMDGENHPMVYRVIESYEKVKNMIRDAEVTERMMVWQNR